VITYALICANDHKFDAWFRNAQAYEDQHARGIVTCPICASSSVEKALMAPAVSRANSDKVALSSGHPEHAKLVEAMRALRTKMISEADDVGDKFAEEARKIHFKEVEARGIYGEATQEEVASLLEDGVDFMPLPSLPEERN
jgi:hypothetical protein